MYGCHGSHTRPVFRPLFHAAVLAVVVLSFAQTTEARADTTQVWRSSSGEIVTNSWDQCVRSDDQIDYDPCAESAPPPPPGGPKNIYITTVISEDDRTVYFAFNKAELTEEGMNRLDTLADHLSSADDVVGAKIIGYADRIGSVPYNEKLSKRRAEAVKDYLFGRGFIKPSTTEVRWVGKSQPSTNCPSPLRRSKLINCLQPDRKVVVEMVRRSERHSDQ